jgi:hypothetical protein
VAVSAAYNTLDMPRTMEAVLDIRPMNPNDALAQSMSDVFNTYPTNWSFTATQAAILYCTSLPMPSPIVPCNDPTPNVAYWTRVTKRMDFTDADRVDGAEFDRILWKGLRDSLIPGQGHGSRSSRALPLAIHSKSCELRHLPRSFSLVRALR